MWNLAVPWWELVLGSAVVYAFLLGLIRLTGERQIGQLAPFDLVLLAGVTYRSQRLEALVEGRPQLYDKALTEARLTHHELNAALRQAGCLAVEEVHCAVLENNGAISVVARKS